MTETPVPADARPAAPKPRRRGLWWKILLAIVVLIVLLLLLLPTLLSTGAGSRFLLEKVNARIPGKITADSLSLGWFSGAKIRNLQLKDPDGKTVLTLTSADTGLTLVDALSPSSLDLGTIVVRGLNATLVTYPDGTTNLGRAISAAPATQPAAPAANSAAPPAASSSPAPAQKYLVKGALDAADCALTWSSPDSPPLAVSNLTAKAAFNTAGGDDSLDLSAQAAAGSNPPAAITAKFAGAFFDDGALKPLGSLTGTGDANVKNLDLAALSPVLEAAGLKATLTGAAQATLTLASTGGHESLTVQVPLTNVTATGAATDGDTFHLATANLSLNALLIGNSVDLQKFQFASDLLNASGSGTIKTSAAADAGPLPPLTLNLAADITALKKQLPKLLGSLPDTQVAAGITGRVDMAAKTLAITAQSAVSEKDAKTNQGNALVLAPGSTLSWGTAANDLHASATYDLARIQQLLGKSLPDGTTLTGSRTIQLHITGPINTTASGLQMLAGLSIDPTSLGFDRIATEGFDLGRSEIPFAMKTGVVTLSPADIPANGGSIHLEGRLDVTRTPALFAIDKSAQPIPLVKNIQINHEMASGPLAFLPLTWGGQKNEQLAAVTGLLNLSLSDASLPLNSDALRTAGTLHGSLRIDNLTTDAPIFTDLLQQLGPLVKISQPDALAIRGGQIPETPFALANGKVTYQNLTIHAQSTDILLSGSVGLDTSLAMNMSVKTKAANIAVPVGLSGTTSKPKLAISGDALKGTLQNLAPKGLDNLLNKKP